MIKNAIQNSSYLVFSQSIVKIISFAYTIYLARNLEVADFGLYVLVLTYFSLTTSIADFGINQYIIREISQGNEKKTDLLTNVFYFRFLVVAAVFFVSGLLFGLIDPDKQRTGLVLIGILAALPQALALTVESLFIAFQKMLYVSIGGILLALFTVFSGVAALESGYSVQGVIWALFFAECLYLLFYLFVAKSIGIKIFSRGLINFRLARFKVFLPYGLLMGLGTLFFKVDVMILNYIRGSFETGIYGVAYKFFEAIVFVPTAISLALFPHLSRLSLPGFEKVYVVYKKTMFAVFIFSLFFVGLFYLVLPLLIVNYFPGYSNSVSALKILTIAIPFLFMTSIQGIVMLSNKKFFRGLLVISLVNLVVNVILNLVFVPVYGYKASAWATVVSYFVGFCLFFVYIKYFAQKKYEISP